MVILDLSENFTLLLQIEDTAYTLTFNKHLLRFTYRKSQFIQSAKASAEAIAFFCGPK
jgi:hypothetical protein